VPWLSAAAEAEEEEAIEAPPTAPRTAPGPGPAIPELLLLMLL
jgi:hypothetical protein